MESIFAFFINFFYRVINLMDTALLDSKISYLDCVIALLIIGIFISVFWKGGKA